MQLEKPKKLKKSRIKLELSKKNLISFKLHTRFQLHVYYLYH